MTQARLLLTRLKSWMPRRVRGLDFCVLSGYARGAIVLLRLAVPGEVSSEEDSMGGLYLGGVDIRQWLLVSVLLFLNVAILGCLFLIITGKVVP